MTEHGHIGDGVYVADDGYQIWLAANHHDNKVIALEPDVLRALLMTIGKVYPVDRYTTMLRGVADEVERVYGGDGK